MKKTAIIISIVAVLLLTAAVFFKNAGKDNRERPGHAGLQNYFEKEEGMENEESRDWVFDRRGCKGSGPVEFGSLPMEPDDFSSFIPYGLMIGSHVTPIDHQYFAPRDYNSPRDAYEVRAVADGTILEIQHRTGPPENGRIMSEYRLVFEHTCTFLSYMDLVTSLNHRIMEKARNDLEKRGFWSGRIPVEEGQLIGKIGGQTLDFGVYNKDIKLGFINPESYESEPWKIHTDKTIKYFTKNLQKILIGKNLRKAEPIDGKIDYDIDGKLAGNWFREGTNGYRGINQQKYWEGHLSFAYDHIDPTGIILSIGDFGGKSVQAIAKKDSPDPSGVDRQDGMVKYELYQSMYYEKDTGEIWNGISSMENPGVKEAMEFYGTAIAEVLDGHKIRFEVFPKIKADQISGFTEKARIYVR